MAWESTDEINRQAAEDIIAAFEAFVKDETAQNTRKLAEYAYLKHFPTVSYLTDYVYEAKLKLFPIAYPDAEVSVSRPTISEANSIIDELKKLK